MTQSSATRVPLNLDSVFEALEQPLALVDDAGRRAELERFVAAARVYQERAIFDLLASVAGAVNASPGSPHVRLEYEGGRLWLAGDAAVETDDAPEGIYGGEGDIERVTIRLPARLKGLIDRAAGARGVSVNRWYVGTLARAIWRQSAGREDAPDAPVRPRRGRRFGPAFAEGGD